MKEEAYDKRGRLKKVKEYTFQSIKEYHVIKRVFVKDIQKNHSTEVTLSDILVDSGIDKKLSSLRYLKMNAIPV